MKIVFLNILILILITSVFGCKEEVTIKENQKVSEFDYDIVELNNTLKFADNLFGGESVSSVYGKTEFGQFARYKDGEISPYKIGLWQKYYDNGQLKEEGRYLIGRYVQCCLSGHCIRYYNYKVGNWKYYYQDGTLELDGNYSIKKMWIDTNCGGDYVKYGILDSDAKLYDHIGIRLKTDIENLKLAYEKEYTYTHPGMYLIPSKESDTIILIGFNN